MEWLQWIVLGVLTIYCLVLRQDVSRGAQSIIMLRRENDLLKKITLVPNDQTLGDKLVEADARDVGITPRMTPAERLTAYKKQLEGLPRDHMYEGSSLAEAKFKNETSAE